MVKYKLSMPMFPVLIRKAKKKKITFFKLKSQNLFHS